MPTRLIAGAVLLAAATLAGAQESAPQDPSEMFRQLFDSGQFHRVFSQAVGDMDAEPTRAALASFRVGSVFAAGLHRLAPALAHYHTGLERLQDAGAPAASQRVLLHAAVEAALAERYARIEHPVAWDVIVLVKSRAELLAPTQDIAVGRAPRGDTHYRLSSAPLPLSRDWVYLQIDRDSDEFARLKPGERGRDFLSSYTGDEFRVHRRDVIRFFAEERQLARPDTSSVLAAYGDFARRHAGSSQASWARRRMRELAAAADPVHGGHETASVPLSDVDSRIPHALTQRPDAVAVVIGNRGYSAYTPDVPDVEFALHDAAVMRRYLTSALGYLDGNVLYYEDATHATFRSVFGTRDVPQGRLAHLVKPGRSDVFVYYSGHGAPDLDTGEGYFVPVDCAPDDVRLNGYAAELLYTHLAQLGARTSTVVVDACFSGGSEGGMVIAAASPVGIQVTAPAMSLPNGAVFASSAGDQISSWYPEMGHGLFTYFFLKGLQGAADRNEDHRITAAEMNAFLTDGNDGVPYWARRLHRGRQQTPRFHGDGTMTLIELARE